MSTPTTIPQASPTALREGNLPPVASQSPPSTKAKASSKRDYKGFVAGVFSGIAKLTGEFSQRGVDVAVPIRKSSQLLTTVRGEDSGPSVCSSFPNVFLRLLEIVHGRGYLLMGACLQI
jgi:hypothetical protein